MPPSGNSLWRYVSKVFKTGGSKERNLRQGNLESLLDGLENLLVLLAADKGDTETLGTETTSTTDTVKVRVGITGKIVVDGKVDTLDIDTTTEDISGDTDTLVELLELLVTLDTVETSEDVGFVRGIRVHTAPLGRHQSGQRYWGSCTRGEACRARLREGCS